MNEAPPSQRIVVAVDRSPQGRAAAEAAADLARRLHAELLALFVEDIELLHVAGLPFVREVGHGGEVRELDVARIERQFRREVREARECCERAAERCRVSMRFDVVRGRVAPAIAAAAAGAEVLVVGRSRGRTAPGRTTRAVLASKGPAVVALVGEGSAGSGPVAVLLPGGEASRRALALVSRLASEDRREPVEIVGREALGERLVEVLESVDCPVFVTG